VKPSLKAAQPYAKAEGRVFLLVPAYPGCPGTKAVKRWLLAVVVVWQHCVGGAYKELTVLLQITSVYHVCVCVCVCMLYIGYRWRTGNTFGLSTRNLKREFGTKSTTCH